MDPADDAYGHAIRDFHEDGEGFEIIERDDGFVGLTGGPEAYFAPYEDWSDREQAAMEHVAGRVLDVGCGAGRHALYCQQQGHDVVGIDISPGAVAVARDRGVEDVRELDVADVADLDGPFETVLMLGNNFGLVGTRERAPDVLADLAAVTTDDARIVAETRDPYATDDPHHREYHDLNRERGRLPGALRMRARYKTYTTPWFDYLLVAPDELDALLAGTAWERTETIDGDGGMYVAILEKA